ncbi:MULTISPECIES: hypothetical protein [Novosphingobium]|uniref:hypothetical protein n=1 Tax=Novosphingobium TaxID=165696 RepID=UPI000D2FFE1A|nr:MULTISPECIES: hypothetical protein [Novosphingobium]PTR07864.1 hypothetical protein C8K11_11375 [Novosphingobium sp. GV055]PUB00677.1 hypothetical protein C8K12_11375 [Novosphingobium sp. GV061]PUB16086.1 hypothetical protein C8K14_11375 [Novosphingobium sp. GV079]PUB39551.1 hypothetical protein C8K10_11375 [Novosphingobium sp. GV027]WQD93779.1 hypothetical protein U0041_04050 [Novosphingobium capsulatum]
MADLSVAPEPAPLATPELPANATPQAFGAGVAGEMAQAGNQMVQAAMQRKEIDLRNRYEADSSDLQLRLAQMRPQMAEQLTQLQQDQALDPKNYAAQAGAIFDKLASGVTEGITSTKLAQQAQVQIAQMRAQYGEQAQNWQSVQLAQISGDRTNKAAELLMGQLRGATKDQAMPIMHQLADLAYSMSDQTPAVRERVALQLMQQGADVWAQSIAASNPEQARQYIADGTFSGFGVPAAQLHTLDRAAQAEIHTRQQVAKQAYSEQVATIRSVSARGIEVPMDQIGPIRNAAMAAGDTSTVSELDGIINANQFAKVYTKMRPMDRERAIATLAGKANPTAAEQEELHWARTHVPEMNRAFESDPVGYLATNGPQGTQPPPLNLNDPNSVSAFVQWRRAASAAYGYNIPVFSDTQLATLRNQYAAGDSGKAEMLSVLDALPPAERSIAAKQIAPADTGFQHLAQIKDFLRGTVRAGQQKLEADKSFLTPDKTKVPGQNAAALLGTMENEINFAMRALSPEDSAAVIENAKAWLAGHLSGKGRDVNALVPGDIFTAALVGLGGYSTKGAALGGIAHWHSGPPYVVPDGFTRAGFEMAVQRDLKRKVDAKMGPVNPDGTIFNLNNAYPVLIGPGRYRWETATGYVSARGADGRPSRQPYITDVRAGQ